MATTTKREGGIGEKVKRGPRNNDNNNNSAKPNRPRPTTTPTRPDSSRTPKKPSSLSLDRPNPNPPTVSPNKPKTLRSAVYLSQKFSSTFSPKSAAAEAKKAAKSQAQSSLIASRSTKKSNPTSTAKKSTAFVPRKTLTPTPNVEDDSKNVMNVETTEDKMLDESRVDRLIDNENVDCLEIPKHSDNIERELDVVSEHVETCDELDHHKDAVSDNSTVLDSKEIPHVEKSSSNPDRNHPEAEAIIDENVDSNQQEEVEPEAENKEIDDVVEEENRQSQKMETENTMAADELELELESKVENSITAEDRGKEIAVEESNHPKKEIIVEAKSVEGVNNNGNPNVAAKLQSAAVQGKESPKPSNDVIEETASKLLERKNKVRALAGAFQTVIDFQRSSMVFVCDEDEKVIGRYAAPGACPYCGGMVQAVDVESQWRFCFLPLYFRTMRRLVVQ